MTSWRDRAACLEDPGGGDQIDDGGLPAIQKLTDFIEVYCHFCPVAQECLDDSYVERQNGTGTITIVDDAQWSVRGGYLPTMQALNGRGRPLGSWPDGWQAKPVPEGAPFTTARNTNLLKRGVCQGGLHGILSLEDVFTSPRGMTCRACQRATSRKQYHGKKRAKIAA